MTLDEQVDKLQLSIDGAIELIRRYDEAALRIIAFTDGADYDWDLKDAVKQLERVYRRELTNVNTSKG